MAANAFQRTLTVGDVVRIGAREATVQRIERVVDPLDVYGVDVASVSWDDAERFVVDLSTGTWAHGDQVEAL